MSEPQEEEHKPHWDSIKDEEVAVEINQVSKAFLGPPLADRPFEAVNAIVFTREENTRVYDNRRVLPGKINSDQELTTKIEEKVDDTYPCKVIQISSLQQFIKVDNDLYRITGCSLTGGSDDSGPFFEARIKFDYQQPVEDPEIIAQADVLCQQ